MKDTQLTAGYSEELIERMDGKDVLCLDCAKTFDFKHALEAYNTSKALMKPKDFQKFIDHPENQFWVEEAKRLLKESPDDSKLNSPIQTSNNPSSASTIVNNVSKSNTQSINLSNFTSAPQLRMLINKLHDQTKEQWDKNGVVQYKDEALAILQRMWGQQVQFIVACSQLSKEGYRLMAIDEGKEGGQSSGGFTGGVNAYFYFQKIDYVKWYEVWKTFNWIEWFRILLTFCSFCGNELSIPNADVCVHCGKFVKGSVASENIPSSKNIPSSENIPPYEIWWYCAPIFFGLFGGLFAYFMLRKKIPRLARNCLIIGIVLTVIFLPILIMLGI